MADISTAYLSFDRDGHVRVQEGTGTHRRDTEFTLADQKIATACGRRLPPDLADLVDVAMTVYVADRVVRRRPRGLNRRELGWKRRLTIERPVRLVERWRRPEVQEALVQCLEFLTDDDWEFVFTQRDEEPRESERQQHLFRADVTSPAQVALFSGGLDSLAGAADAIADRSAGSLVLVAGVTHSRLRYVLRMLSREIRDAAVRDVHFLTIPLRLCQNKAEYQTNERSQRSRGFLYGLLGVVTAGIVEAEEVAFYESGIGAINLPYSPAQLSTHATRSTNPIFLAYLTRFVQCFTERPIELRLPYLFSTKAEMCASLATSALRDSVVESVTCDKYPRREKGASQCGVCTSCLLRRQALWAAGLEEQDPGHLYLYDVVGEPAGVPDQIWHPLRDMLGQVDTIRRALAATRPWDALVGEYPMLGRVAWTLGDQAAVSDPAEAQARLMNLLHRYCAEWERFPTQPPGWAYGTPDPTTDWRLRHAC